MKCRKCNLVIPDGSAFCNHCGVQQEMKKNRRTRGNGTGTAFKRGKTWRVEITMGKLPDGRPNRRTKDGFKTKREALDYIPTLRGEKPRKAKTLSYYYESYSTAEMLRLGKTTQGAYRKAWERLESIRNIPMRDLSVVQLRDLVADEAPTFDPASDMKSLLSHMFKLAIADQEVTVNLSEYILLPPKNSTEQVPWSHEEQQIIWKAYSEGDVFASYLLLMIYTGMMPGELQKCTRSMINLEKRIIVGTGLKTKTRKTSPIVLADIIIPVIQSMLDSIPDEPEQRILPLSKTSFYDAYHEFTKKYQIRDLPMYSCRHTTATALALAEVSPPVIKKVMRHARLSTTEIYIHPDSADALAAVNRLSGNGSSSDSNA